MSDFPLYDIFNRLRQAGFPLGLDEYHLAMRALQGGFGVSDSQALKRLCHTLWVKSGESSAESVRFNRIFNQTLQEWKKVSTSAKSKPNKTEQPLPQLPVDSPTPPSEVGRPSDQGHQKHEMAQPTPRENQEKRPSSVLKDNKADIKPPSPTDAVEKYGDSPDKTEIKGSSEVSERSSSSSEDYKTPSWWSEWEIPSGRSMPFVESANETETIQAILTTFDDEMLDRFFDFSHDYLPITQRQMQQSWRNLRFPVRRGPQRELDIEATVRQIVEDGFFLEPILIPRRTNRAELLLLLDQDGSMVPFHVLSKHLRNSAMLGGQLGKVNIFYFHNCPINNLYHDKARLQPEKLDDLFAELNTERTGILIFSDAGAARGGYNQRRIKRTRQFIDRLTEHVQHIGWLNPMPKERWAGTTAGTIADFVPMFEITRLGMDNVIDVLRGRAR